MRIPTLLFTSLLFATGCASASGPSQVPLDEPFELAPGDTAEADGLTVRFEAVTQDSRCPVDVVCVWQGDATVVLALTTSADAAASRELHTGIEPRETRFASYAVGLVSVAPAPRSTVKIAPEDYRVTLRVTR